MLVRDEIAEALGCSHGVIALRDHPGWARRLRLRVARNELVVLLPGIYALPTMAGETLTRIWALHLWQRDAVLTGPAAAHLTFWRDLRPDVITASLPNRHLDQPGYSFTRERIPPELTFERAGVRATRPALTALDLVATHGGAGIDRALLQGACKLADMHEALRLTPRRRGNPARRAMLHDSRDEPWSEAERLLHAILRQAGITGWAGNHGVQIGGRGYYVDLAFVSRRLAIEVDGYEVHSRRAQFEKDRHKWSDLQAAGWRVLHFTWWQLVDERDWVVATIRAALSRGSRPTPRSSPALEPRRRSAVARAG